MNAVAVDVSGLAPLDPERIVRVLAEHRVDYVLIGALAARLQGFPRLTADADITPARDPENLERLASALRALDARIFTDALPEGLAFDCSAETFSRATMWNLVTSAGRLDVAFVPAGTEGFEDLAAGAVRFDEPLEAGRRPPAGPPGRHRPAADAGARKRLALRTPAHHDRFLSGSGTSARASRCGPP